MRTPTFFGFLIALALALLAPPVAWSATPAETAEQARNQWKKAKETYLEAVRPYQGKPEHAELLKQYGAALDGAGQALEQYLSLKLAAAPAAKITPAVDQLAKSLGQLRTLRGQAQGDLLTVLGKALGEQNLVAQTALKNMR